MANSSRRKFLWRTGTAALAALLGGEVHAHARMTRSQPKDGASLTEPPKAIELWFNELLDEKFNTVEMFRMRDGKKGANLLTKKPQVDPGDRTRLSVGVPPLEPGNYVVEYRVLSRDGHSAPGRLKFDLKPDLKEKPQG